MLPAAIAINALIGVLYVWSLFLSPIEARLSISRSALSFVPAIGLLCFTLGVFVHNLLIPRLRIGLLAPTVLIVAGLGHLLFWLFPGYPGLLLGYGIVFGTAAGIGYGLALAMARQSSAGVRGWAVGVTVAAFAASGMALAALDSAFSGRIDAVRSFGYIGAVFCASGTVLVFVLRRSSLAADSQLKPDRATAPIGAFPWFCLALGYFSLCYPGLVLVSHGTAILASLGASEPVSSGAPLVVNAGYLSGALLGGLLPTWLPGRTAPAALLCTTTICVALITIPLPLPIHALAMFVIGLGLGSVVSVFYVLLSQKYSADRASALFARLNIGYGLAGFLAPSVTGGLYDLYGSYHSPLGFAVVIGAVGLIAVLNGAVARTIA